jgi:hypothetical protein
VSKDEEHRFLLGKAQIIDELEATLPIWLERAYSRWWAARCCCARCWPCQVQAQGVPCRLGALASGSLHGS